jgi:hypothetical protein
VGLADADHAIVGMNPHQQLADAANGTQGSPKVLVRGRKYQGDGFDIGDFHGVRTFLII